VGIYFLGESVGLDCGTEMGDNGGMSLVTDVFACPVCQHDAQACCTHPEGVLMRCPSCTHCFTDPRTVAAESYSKEYFRETHKNWFANPNLELFGEIAKIAVSKGGGLKVLDVGCGMGDFLLYLRGKEPTFVLTGIDLAAPPSVDGIRFITGDFYKTDLGSGFDFVVSLAVIEHVGDIRSFVSRIKALAKPGATVVLMTLNEGGLIYSVSKWMNVVGFDSVLNRLYSKHHLHHFTTASLRCLVESAGMEVLSQGTHNFPLAAVDFAECGFVADRLKSVGVALLFALGRIWKGAFLQTVVCKV